MSLKSPQNRHAPVQNDYSTTSRSDERKIIASSDTVARGNPYTMPQGYNLVTMGGIRVNGFVTDPVTLAYHELRGPLALMVTIARSAADDCADDILRSRCLSIVRTAERMLRTAGEVMVVAETASRDETQQFAPADVAQKVVADYKSMDVMITFESPAVSQLEVSAAAAQLEALLCSIIGNALDHGSKDHPVEVSVTESHRAVMIQVRNRMDRTRNHRGLGLGSYIGDRLARSLNAALELTRTDDEFVARISIPAAGRALALAI